MIEVYDIDTGKSIKIKTRKELDAFFDNFKE